MKKTLCIIISLLLVTTFCTSCAECNCNCTSAPIDNRESSNQTEEDSLSNSDDSVEKENLSTSDTTSDSADYVEDDDIDINEAIQDDNEVEKREEKEERRLYKKAKKMYLSGKWVGTKPIKLGSRTISRSEYSGDILIDGYQVGSYQKCIDLPESFDETKSNSKIEYIPNQGVYVIEDRILVKYVRGKKIMLKGGSLKWKGFDPQKLDNGYRVDGTTLYLPNSDNSEGLYILDCIPYLYYHKEANQLILVTTNPLKKCQYLYIFPDYNVSKTKYLKKISEFYILGGTEQEDKFYYVDMKGTAWLYTKKGPKKVSKEIFY